MKIFTATVQLKSGEHHFKIAAATWEAAYADAHGDFGNDLTRLVPGGCAERHGDHDLAHHFRHECASSRPCRVAQGMAAG